MLPPHFRETVMTVRRAARILPVAALLALSLSPRVAPAQGAPVRIRLGTLAPQGTSYHRILQEMGERWRTATNGQVQLTVYAGTMGSEAELVRRMRLGQLQAAALTGVGIGDIDGAISALQEVPMLFRTLEEFQYVRTRMEPVLAQRLAERGFVVIFWGDAGWVRFFTRRPALHPDEFKRLKIFVTAGDNDQFDLMRSAGFTPVFLDWSDALTGLQTGMIDAVPTIPYFALSMQFQTVAANMLELNWLPLIGATLINKSTWDGLSAETQAALRAAAAEAGRQFQARGRAESDEAVAAMRRRGLTVEPVPPATDAEWRTLSESFWPRIRGRMVPADMFDEVQRVVAEYRASRPR
jgi:TRAP-type C4-dicarboxylate transport system substrate-binding protein